MEFLRHKPNIEQNQDNTSLKQSIVENIDHYLRRNDCVLAELADTLCPYKGTDYLNSQTKRFLDLGVAIPAALVTAPAVMILGIAKKLEDGGTAFFIQERVGQHQGKTIDIIKIRCMQPKSDKGGENLQISRRLDASQDPRNTRLGTFMRKYQLEELPQLFQVIQGKLSVMGIRPDTQYGFDNLKEVWSEERYKKWVDAYRSAALGISGLYQVFGSSVKEDEDKFHLDMFYTKNASLGLDLYLIWKTAVKMLGIDS